jgi:hypothetical protein
VSEGRWQQQVAILWLALCLVAFGFETARHSVHHISGPKQPADCQVLSASKHLTSVSGEISTVSVVLHATAAMGPLRWEPLPPGFSSPVHGRAPPLFSS